MSKEMAIIVLGIWVMIVPYLGVPGAWRTVLLLVTGFGLVVLGFFLRAEVLSRGPRHGTSHPFVENLPAGRQVLPDSAQEPVAHEHKEGIGPLN